MRFLSSLLIAFALFCSPVAMASGAGMAHGAMVDAAAMDGHCSDPVAPADEDGELGMKMQCMSACSAMHVAGHALSQRQFLAEAAVDFARPRGLAGIAPESETPPPRNS